MCGAEHAACGAASDAVPVDSRMEVAVVGGPLKRYTVTTPSGVETVMKLNDDDAERLGGVPLAGAPTETQTPGPDASVKTTTETPSKARSPRNKARTAAADKDGGTGGGD